MHPHLWAASNTSREEMETLLAELGLHPAPLTGQADPLGDYGLVSLEPVEPIGEQVERMVRGGGGSFGQDEASDSGVVA